MWQGSPPPARLHRRPPQVSRGVVHSHLRATVFASDPGALPRRDLEFEKTTTLLQRRCVLGVARAGARGQCVLRQSCGARPVVGGGRGATCCFGRHGRLLQSPLEARAWIPQEDPLARNNLPQRCCIRG